MVHYLNHGVSDHTPLICQLGPKESSRGRPFRFNYLAAHKDFIEIAQGVWQSVYSRVATERVWHKLKGVKQKLKQLHVQQFQQVHNNILKWQEVLNDTQSQLQQDPLVSALHAT